MDNKTDFTLKDQAYRLLARNMFKTIKEKSIYAGELKKTLNELSNIQLELSLLRPAQRCTNGLLIGEDDNLEINQLIRKINNRLKVLPLEPVEQEYLWDAGNNNEPKVSGKKQRWLLSEQVYGV